MILHCMFVTAVSYRKWKKIGKEVHYIVVGWQIIGYIRLQLKFHEGGRCQKSEIKLFE